MISNQPMAALFDLDGVIFDTESQYTIFWGEQCRQFRPDIPDLNLKIKGQTLSHIYEDYFPDPELQKLLTQRLNDFEHSMVYNYIPGVYEFLKDLKAHGVKTVVVTSSNHIKMDQVRQAHPDFDELFDRVLTSEDFAASKPDPFCYLLGAKVCNAPLENCMVFEDSFNGIKAGMAAHIFTLGLATTNKPEDIAPLCNAVVSDFVGMDYQKFCEFLTK